MKGRTSILFLFLAASLGLVWYNHQHHQYGYPFMQLSSGISYKRMMPGNGRKIQHGEWVIFSFEIKKIADKKKQAAQAQQANGATTIANESNILWQFNDNLVKPYKQLIEVIGMVEEKQRMIFKCTPQHMLADVDPLSVEALLKIFQLKADDKLMVDITVNKIMTDAARMEMVRKKAEDRAAQLEKDKKLIIDYLKEHNIPAETTDAGLFYTIDQPSQDAPVVQNETVAVHYIGKFLDGTVFDTSIAEVAKAHNLYNATRDYKPFKFLVGNGEVIAGWDKGLPLLKKNEKARFFIPSALAYGEKGNSHIPPNTVLIFDIQVINIGS
ncbi:FKBP-type peptidyl-prolyl cis-trans isomerase [Candidatus Cardinium hertigii]|uniref:peptidylprolyl isomerase n=1 Tax=Candidatus Cardinium hertigii TaxID=247481 RepID=A0A2Z3L8A0_9BACT|nr:FKBP-type peptidyl-prolyl cis-trans isomerase [Candidatus Cardinium hertigii]AWN81848.1 putative FKBP-type peptidyl-prolyl cis-trans isomerase [Candidatus Cardinium hertigii]